jgi:formate dehydrogenase subunit delta
VLEKLIMNANQIGAFFRAQGEAVAPAEIADHMRKFWDPVMRADIVAHLERGGEGLEPLVRRGVELLRQSKT